MSQRRLAVIVGINNYTQEAFGALTCCENDATAIRDALINCAQFKEDDVVLLLGTKGQTNYGDIIAQLKNMCDSANSEDLLLFYFAGHGYGSSSESYLITSDIKTEIIDETSISLEKIQQYFKKSKAKLKISVFDACHSGRFRQRSGSTSLRNADIQKLTAEGWINLAACKEDEAAHELDSINHGVFTYYLVKGMVTGAEENKQLTIDQLKDYVISNTMEYTNKLGVRQTPFSSGEIAGVTIFSAPASQVSSMVGRLANFDIDSTIPSQDNQDEFSIMLSESIANARKAKEEKILDFKSRDNQLDEYMQIINSEFEKYVEKYADKFQDLADISINKFTDLSQLPGQSFLGRKFFRNPLNSASEFNVSTRTKQVPKSELMAIPDLRLPQFLRTASEGYKLVEKTEDVHYGSGIYGHTNSLTLEIKSKTRAMPTCSVTLAFLPTSFGGYFLWYFLSTIPDGTGDEQESDRNIIQKYFQPINVTDLNSLDLIHDMLNGFTSFVDQSIKTRLSLIERFTSSSKD